MSSFSSIALSKDFSILVVDGVPSYEKEFSDAIDAVWEKEKEKNPHLFNGTLLKFVKLEGSALFVARVPYKVYLAQRAAPHLKNTLGVRPVCVSCVTECEGRFLIGKRSSSVTAFPCRFELAPSGGLDEKAIVGDCVKAALQVYEELREETGIRSGMVEEVVPYLFIKNDEEEVFEICCRVRLHRDALELGENPRDEYQELWWFTREEAAAHLRQHCNDYVPVSKYLLSRCLASMPK